MMMFPAYSTLMHEGDGRARHTVERTNDLDAIVGAVTDVYCEHTVNLKSASFDARLTIEGSDVQPVVSLQYGAPVSIDAGRFPNLLLMMTAQSGAARVVQNGTPATWKAGQIMPLSPERETLLDFDRAFAQKSLRVDIERLEQVCAAWLGYPLERPIAFDLQAVPEPFERIWRDSIALAISLAAAPGSASRRARATFDEFLISAILNSIPHNFSAELAKPAPASTPRLVTTAKQMFADGVAADVGVMQVASALGVSVRSLQAGFRNAGETTPSAWLRKLKLQAAQKALTDEACSVSVTDIAFRFGFSHPGRFSAAYQTLFGESPVVTLRRNRRRRQA
jgi:AraC-like DNA-binding protein